ncbi:DUF3450 domain-containing protein [Marinobacter lacisalsi]|uniref:DUF3450 domain-containing protein n=1 Tax=Marinobacter lacisalsi TaxID=475979 RepID=A0ABV8QKU1_9GAMM
MSYLYLKAPVCAGLALCLTAISGLYAPHVTAADLDDVTRQAADRVAQTTKAEKAVAGLDQQTRQIAAEYRQLLMEAEQLSAYNRLVAQQVANQEDDIQRLEQTVQNAEGMEQKLLPIVTDMMSSLENFVELDKPFLLEERQRSIEELYESLEDPSESLAITLRRVIDTYQAEIEYGRNLQSWRQSLATGSSEREVDMLRVGRLALMYRTLDRKEIALWQPDSREWQILDANQWNRAFDQARKIARKQAAPDLVTIPVFATSTAFKKEGVQP